MVDFAELNAKRKADNGPIEEPEDVIIPNSTALTTKEEAGVLALPDELDGFMGYEGISSDTWVIPRIKIVQPTSKEGNAGKLRVNLTGEEFDRLSVIVIKATQGRILWGENGTEVALCRSNDFYHPDTAIESPQHSMCARVATLVGGKKAVKVVCPKALWGANRERPDCDETFNLLCLMPAEQLPFWITLSGMSIRPVKNYLSAIALRRSPLWVFETVLGLQEQKNAKGRFFIAHFDSPKPISKNLEAEIAPIVAGIRNADIQRTFEAEEAAAEDGGMDDSGAPPVYEDGELVPEEPPWFKEGDE